MLNEEGEHTLGSRPFHPMYPVYNFNTQPHVQSTTFSPQDVQPHAFGGEGSSIATPGSISEDGIIQKY
jgi:hypothetical protein